MPKQRRPPKQHHSLLLCPANSVATLMDDESHRLRSVIQLKWSIAEHELSKVAEHLKAPGSTIRNTFKDKFRAIYKSALQGGAKKIVDEMHPLFHRLANQRNILTHGNLHAPQSNTTLHVEGGGDARTPFTPFFQGTLSMHGRRENDVVSLDRKTLQKIDAEIDNFLNMVVELLTALDLDEMMITAHIQIHGDPNITIGTKGERSLTWNSTVRIRDVWKQPPVETP